MKVLVGTFIKEKVLVVTFSGHCKNNEPSLTDLFKVACLDDFIENSRLMIFETFCRIHQCISISMLAEKLNMSTEEAERWIVNLIR